MANKSRNVGASVRTLLLKRAEQSGADFQILLTRYAIERLLYRLSVSPARDQFILKGAMLFTTWVVDPFRPTRDLDLLAAGDPTADRVLATFQAICTADVEDDGVVFDAAGLQVSTIRNDDAHGGLRVKTTATIDKAKIAIQVDIGFGDAVTPAPVEITFPLLLPDRPAAVLKAYPVETVIAEKFEALVSLGLANTRLKDFYDLWCIAQTFDLQHDLLAEAVHNTFARRQTSLPTAVPAGLSDAFVASRAVAWRAFVKRNAAPGVPAELADVVVSLRGFLMPLVDPSAVVRRWPPGGPWGKGT
jgi:hypothetical protein